MDLNKNVQSKICRSFLILVSIYTHSVYHQGLIFDIRMNENMSSKEFVYVISEFSKDRYDCRMSHTFLKVSHDFQVKPHVIFRQKLLR